MGEQPSTRPGRVGVRVATSSELGVGRWGRMLSGTSRHPLAVLLTFALMTDEDGPIDGERIEKLVSGVETSRGTPNRLASQPHNTSARTMPSTDWRSLMFNRSSLALATTSVAS